MTAEERRNPDLMNPSRKKRIVTGRRRGHRRSQPPGKTVRRYEKLMKQLPAWQAAENARVLADSAVCLAR